MKRTDKIKAGEQKGGFWNFIDRIEGDKVIWIIVFLLTMLSALAIFSSTSQIARDSADRVDLIKQHFVFIAIGYAVILLIYNIRRIGIFRFLSQFGFFVSLVLLTFLVCHIDLGFIKAAQFNHAWRVIKIGEQQLHVYEVVKVAMVMYLAWAIDAYKQDQEAVRARKKSTTLTVANRIATHKSFAFMAKPFWKKTLYIYLPILITCVLVMFGSNSSAVFIGGIMLAILIIGGLPLREVWMAFLGIAAILAFAVGVYVISDGAVFERVGTAMKRLNADYGVEKLLEIDRQNNGRWTKEWYDEYGRIKQPYSAKIAIHEGGFLGKGSGNSTQKYVVTHIYSDYMFSFIVEEYGLLGGILVLILYVSLLARGSMIARLCTKDFTKIAAGGLTFMITAQAFMHILVNVGLGPMTGQTLPLLSDGSFAFIVFCIAFGIILSISRIARNQIKEEEEAAEPLYESNRDDIQAAMDVLEQIDSDRQ